METTSNKDFKVDDLPGDSGVEVAQRKPMSGKVTKTCRDRS